MTTSDPSSAPGRSWRLPQTHTHLSLSTRNLRPPGDTQGCVSPPGSQRKAGPAPSSTALSLGAFLPSGTAEMAWDLCCSESHARCPLPPTRGYWANELPHLDKAPSPGLYFLIAKRKGHVLPSSQGCGDSAGDTMKRRKCAILNGNTSQ